MRVTKATAIPFGLGAGGTSDHAFSDHYATGRPNRRDEVFDTRSAYRQLFSSGFLLLCAERRAEAAAAQKGPPHIC